MVKAMTDSNVVAQFFDNMSATLNVGDIVNVLVQTKIQENKEEIERLKNEIISLNREYDKITVEIFPQLSNLIIPGIKAQAEAQLKILASWKGVLLEIEYPDAFDSSDYKEWSIYSLQGVIEKLLKYKQLTYWIREVGVRDEETMSFPYVVSITDTIKELTDPFNSLSEKINELRCRKVLLEEEIKNEEKLKNELHANLTREMLKRNQPDLAGILQGISSNFQVGKSLLPGKE